MKKILALALAVAMLLSCGAAFAEEERMTDRFMPPHVNEGQYPVPGNKTLSWWMEINKSAVAFISSYAENTAYQEIEKQTGINIEFIHPTVGMAKEQFNLLFMDTGSLPDIIMLSNDTWYEGGLNQMYEDGLIIDVAPYLEQYAPQYKSLVDGNRAASKKIYQGDNADRIYGFYRMDLGKAIPFNRCICRADWLEEFGMSVPTTIAEYEAYFDAVLANKPGVTPFYMSLSDSSQQVLLMGAFDMYCNWYQIDGQAHYYANEPAYKDYLALMNKWYEKGYMSKDLATLTSNEVYALFDGGQLACYTGNVDQAYDRLLSVEGVKQTPCPYMRKEADSKLHTDISNAPVSSGLAYVSVITTNCKDVEAAVQLLNYSYTWEGAVIAGVGVEGLTFEWKDGVPYYTDYVLNNPDGKTAGNIAYCDRIHLGSKMWWGDNLTGPYTGKAINRKLYSDDPNVDNAYVMPAINLSTEDTERRNEIMAEVDTYVAEMKFAFITGKESLDNFDKYVEKVNSLGLPEAIEITQRGLDCYFAD